MIGFYIQVTVKDEHTKFRRRWGGQCYPLLYSSTSLVESLSHKILPGKKETTRHRVVGSGVGVLLPKYHSEVETVLVRTTCYL